VGTGQAAVVRLDTAGRAVGLADTGFSARAHLSIPHLSPI
jgi:hypothetical protein